MRASVLLIVLAIITAVINPLSIICLLVVIALAVVIARVLTEHSRIERLAAATYTVFFGLIVVTTVIVAIPGATAGGASRLATCTADLTEPLRNSVAYFLSAESLLNIGIFAIPTVAAALLHRPARWPAVVALALLSPTVEALQALLGSRVCTWMDVVHNVFGVALGYGIGSLISLHLRRRAGLSAARRTLTD